MKIIEGKDLVNMKFVKTEDGLLKEYKPQGRFISKEDEMYFYINSTGNIYHHKNAMGKIDNYIINHNLVFRTIEKCEDYRWFLEQLDKYKTDFSKEEWKDTNIDKYFLILNHATKKIDYSSNKFCQSQGVTYFTKDNIEKFVEVVGKERIKKYLFNVWE